MKKENELMSATKLIAESVATLVDCIGMYEENADRQAQGYANAYGESAFSYESDKLIAKISELEKSAEPIKEEKFAKPLKFNERICVTVSNEKQISALLDFLSDVGYTLCDIPYSILTSDIFKTFPFLHFYSYGDNNEKLTFSFDFKHYGVKNNEFYFTNELLSTFTKESFLDRYLVKD